MRRRPAGRERGISESVQWAILGTVFLACLLGIIEAGLLLHARSVVVAAAQAASEAQAAWGASPGQADQVAHEFVAEGGLAGATVDVAASATDVTVTVSADAPSLIGWASPRVTARSTRPLEQS